MQPQNSDYFNTEFVKRNLLPIIFGLCGLIFFAYGLIQLSAQSTSKDDIVFESNESESKSATSSASLTIDVSGGVEKPGVYKIPADSRMQDAIMLAGGFSKDADREWVSKNLNLALKVKDGTKIYIPVQGEQAQGADVKGVSTVSSNLQGININSASQSELEALSGIGPVTAQKIIDGRQYAGIEELLEKKIVTKSVFEKIKEKITVY